MNPRIYLYKVTFEEVPYWYWGVHKERKFEDGYIGSPHTNKWCWEWYTPTLEIKQLFEYSEEGWREAMSVEDRVIRPDLNSPLCLNARVGGTMSLEACRKGARRKRELGIPMPEGVKITPVTASGLGRLGGAASAVARRASGRLLTDCSNAGKVGGKVTSAQRWECLETGHVSSAASLARWQVARGIDTSKRKRIS
jgi:hypothetical protein